MLGTFIVAELLFAMLLFPCCLILFPNTRLPTFLACAMFGLMIFFCFAGCSDDCNPYVLTAIIELSV